MVAVFMVSVFSTTLVSNAAESITVIQDAFEEPYVGDNAGYVNVLVEDKGGDRSVFGLEYIGGIRFSNLFFLGAGIGLNFHSFSDDFVLDTTSDWDRYISGNCPENLVSVPLYLHTRLYFTHTRCQPFFALSVGGQITGLKTAKGYDEIYYNPSCFMITPQLGVNYQLNDKASMYLTAGCLWRNIVTSVYYYTRNEEMNVVREVSEGLAFKMSLGVTF